MYLLKKYSGFVTSLAISLSLVVCFVAEGFCAADNVRNECLRLHILASSDSEEDQRVKLLVRDEVLKFTEALFSESTSSDEACRKIREHTEEIEAVADRVLSENGFTYKARLNIENEYFDTRQYDNVTLPAGEYTACKIILGEGKGHNWWCVMFPGICLPAATESTYEDVYAVFGQNGGDLVTGKQGYKIRFRIVEVFEQLINRKGDN